MTTNTAGSDPPQPRTKPQRPTLVTASPGPPGPARRDPGVEEAMLDPERQLIGCLLQMSAAAARRLMVGIEPDDIARPMNRHIMGLINQVIALGDNPTPARVLAHAVTTGQANGDVRRGWLGHELITLLQAAPVPAIARAMKQVVLESAWRRAIAIYAKRLQQSAETSAVDVTARLYADRAAIEAVAARYTAAQPDSWIAPLTAIHSGTTTAPAPNSARTG